MHLQTHYDALRQAAFRQLAQGRADLDTLLDAAGDDRRGLTLLGRPPRFITAVLAAILADFQQDEPEQYYYPVADIHLTILSLISCYRGFALPSIVPADYQAIIHDILRQTPPIKLTFAGLTASPGGIMVQGFPADEGLQHLRDQLRRAFQQSGLQQSIDQRYRLQTAHATLIRFRRPLRDAPRLLQKLAAYEHAAIGTFEVAELEFVYNDWYQRAANTVLLAKYSLPTAS